MANDSRLGFAGIAGAVIGVVVVGALAATPWYLSSLQSEDRRTDLAVASDIETIRRAILAADPVLCAESDMRNSVGYPKDLDGQVTDRMQAKNPKIFDSSRSTLDATRKMILNAVDVAKKHGTDDFNIQIANGVPNARNSIADMAKASHEFAGLMQQADKAASHLSSISGSANHLGANRIRAMLAYLKGRVAFNQAEYEHRQASAARADAQSMLPELVSMRATVDSLAASRPDAAVAALRAESAAIEGQLGKIRAARDGLKAQIAAAQSEHDELRQRAAVAQRELAELSSRGSDFATYQSKYNELATQARAAEVRAAIIENGTLDQATRVESAIPDSAPPTYTGGQPIPGLRTLKFRLGQIEDQLAGAEKMVADRKKRAQRLTKASEQSDEASATAKKEFESATGAIDKLLEKADRYDLSAAKAEKDAVRSLDDAARFARNAITSASRRTTDARSGASAGTTPDERLTAIASDGDTEGSLHCLSAEASYYVAALNLAKCEAMKGGYQARALIANATAGAKPKSVDAEIAKLRETALQQAGEAAKSYERAASAIQKTSAKLGAATISGRNYLWQVQLGQAAVVLLQGAIVGVNTPEAVTAREQAYKILVEAVKGREQSPLLAPALATVRYLQSTSQ